jgi:DNA polymerase-3 subunit epsilon
MRSCRLFWGPEQTALSPSAAERGYAVFDFETTGLSWAEGDRVVQVAVVHLSSEGLFESEWESLVNPQRGITSTEIHGITEELVASAPTFPQVWPRLLSAFNNRIVVAHNASFDLGFLWSELARFNPPADLPRLPVFDTLRLAHLVEGAPNRRQRSLAATLGIDPLAKPGRGPHDALTDAHVASDILRHYLNEWPHLVNKGIRNFPEAFAKLKPANLTTIGTGTEKPFPERDI